jgi:hypothetical protein
MLAAGPARAGGLVVELAERKAEMRSDVEDVVVGHLLR